MTSKPFIIPHKADEWSEKVGAESFRTWDRKGVSSLWRRTDGEHYYGGYIIHVIPLDTPLALEWLDNVTKATGRPCTGIDLEIGYHG